MMGKSREMREKKKKGKKKRREKMKGVDEMGVNGKRERGDRQSHRL